ncbi:MAG: zinc-finger domain-containing protein [Legionellales bacterium]|nr:zinc-finger domain-containing protein [Legionellales bacterium]
MIETKKQAACTEKSYLVHLRDLPLSCPTEEMALWNAHPKVYLSIESSGVAVCPYCSARFVLSND